MSNQSWNEQKFQTHWNKLEWVNTRSSSKGKNLFYVSSNEFYLKDNNKTVNWVNNQKLKHQNLEVFF